MIGWLRLPPVHAISAATELGDAVFLARLEAALRAGLRMLQLREPGMAADRFDTLFRTVRALCDRHAARLLVNSAHPSSYWRAAGGVHFDEHLVGCWLGPGDGAQLERVR